MLSFLPDSFLIWAINIILLLGVVGTVASILFKFLIQFLPSVIPFRLLLQVVSAILLVLGVYLKGGYAVEAEWRARVAELEAKIAVAEQQSKDANVQLQEVMKQKNKVVKEKQIVIQTKIKEVEKRIDAECKVDSEAVKLLNESARSIK